VRLLVGVLILLALFSAAALWQRSWKDEARSSRDSFSNSRQEASSANSGDGWSRVVLGRPSGGEPYAAKAEETSPGSTSAIRESPADPAREGGPGPAQGTKSPAAAPPAPELDPVVTVKAGQTLSEICHEHYGSARQELVLAVARYNQLTGPDEIREGQRILLPALERIGDGR
jgi:nucleoid-associated protein YgaU